MFGRKKTVKGYISSPVRGETLSLDKVEDEVFSSKMLGDGIAVEPSSGDFVSPCDGKVASIAKTAHAYNIISNDGLEILVHIGIDTVELKGEGFEPKVTQGDEVKRGDALCKADIELIKSRGYSTVTPIVISNISELSFFDRHDGSVKEGDVLIDYVM